MASALMETFLVPLLLKLGVMASIASILARSNSFKAMLMQEDRDMRQRLTLSLWFSLIFGASVATRVFDPVDRAAHAIVARLEVGRAQRESRLPVLRPQPRAFLQL